MPERFLVQECEQARSELSTVLFSLVHSSLTSRVTTYYTRLLNSLHAENKAYTFSVVQLVMTTSTIVYVLAVRLLLGLVVQCVAFIVLARARVH